MTMCAPKDNCDRIFFNGAIQSMDEYSSIHSAMAVRE